MPTTNERPASFDAAVLAYMPFIRRMVNRANPKSTEDMVQDVVVEAMATWHLYNSNYKFGTWMRLVVRNVTGAQRLAASRKKRTAAFVPIDKVSLSVAPSQHDYAELSEALRNLSGTRDSDVLMRLAMGEGLAEVGEDMGLSRERVRQLAERERARLRVS